MHKHPTPTIKTILDKPYSVGEVLEEVLVIHVIDFDDSVLVIFEEIFVEREA